MSCSELNWVAVLCPANGCLLKDKLVAEGARISPHLRVIVVRRTNRCHPSPYLFLHFHPTLKPHRQPGLHDLGRLHRRNVSHHLFLHFFEHCLLHGCDIGEPHVPSSLFRCTVDIDCDLQVKVPFIAPSVSVPHPDMSAKCVSILFSGTARSSISARSTCRWSQILKWVKYARWFPCLCRG